MPFEKRQEMIEPEHPDIPVKRQCELLGISRAGWYYKPQEKEDELNKLLMRLIYQQYTKTPFYGILKMTEWLCRQGYRVNHKRVKRLMRKMGLMAIYPGPNLSRGKGHKKYPYLLKGMAIVGPNQVWSTDITYIRLAHGFVYLVAIIDWYSRYVLSWELSNTLDAGFCVEVLDRALKQGRPEIFNTDQGTQFTSEAFVGRLASEGIRISMDGSGRALDNIFVERLWRSVKYEDVYIHDYRSVAEAREGIGRYFKFYNYERLHQSLKYQTPEEVHYNQQNNLAMTAADSKGVFFQAAESILTYT